MGLGYDVGADELRVSLDVTKRAEPDPVQAEDPLVYTIRITNTGQLTLTAAITDILPLNVTTSDPVAWTSVIIIPGAVWTNDIVVQTQIAGQLTNVVKVTTDEGATGIFTETSVVTSTPDIVVTPLALSEMLAPGGTAQHTLTISNVGRAELTWSLVETPTVGWLSEASMGDVVLPSNSQDVAVDFSAVGLTDGLYNTTLQIISDDPFEPRIDVSAVLTVCTPVSGLSFTVDPTAPEVGLPVNFTAVAAGTAPIIYTWDFGDNGGGTGNPIAHTYTVSDTYTVVVTATNCYGAGVVTYQEDIWVTGVTGERIFLPLVLKNS